VEDLLGFPVNFVCTDGAFLFPKGYGQPVFESINPEVTKSVLQTLKEQLNVVYMVSNDEIISFCEQPDLEIRSWGFKLRQDDFCSEKDINIKQIEQIIILDQAANARAIYKKLKSILPGIKLDMSPSLKSGYNQLIIRPDAVDKGSGLRSIAERLKIDLRETVAFGDWLNDLPMFKEAGLAIAPASAVPEVREQADIVSDYSNDEDFIAIEIEKLLAEKIA
jgi:hydroxymethylpyrimidine pyrophosphatase-like HAD family hydrolase